MRACAEARAARCGHLRKSAARCGRVRASAEECGHVRKPARLCAGICACAARDHVTTIQPRPRTYVHARTIMAGRRKEIERNELAQGLLDISRSFSESAQQLQRLVTDAVGTGTSTSSGEEDQFFASELAAKHNRYIHVLLLVYHYFH